MERRAERAMLDAGRARNRDGALRIDSWYLQVRPIILIAKSCLVVGARRLKQSRHPRPQHSCLFPFAHVQPNTQRRPPLSRAPGSAPLVSGSSKALHDQCRPSRRVRTSRAMLSNHSTPVHAARKTPSSPAALMRIRIHETHSPDPHRDRTLHRGRVR